MITIQLSFKAIHYCLVCVGAILIASITSCSTVRSSHYMVLYSECHLHSSKAEAKPDKASNKEAANSSYKLHKRVRRWKTDDINTMRKFTPYAHLTDEELWLQQAFHYLPGVGNLISREDNNNYFINTPEGKCAEASLVLVYKKKNKPKEVYVKGKVQIGIDLDDSKPTIYHMMFNPKKNIPSLKIPYMPLMKTNNYYQKDGTKVGEIKKSHQEGFQAYKVKRTITYFNKAENAYFIKYTPPGQSPYKLITLIIHRIMHQGIPQQHSPSSRGL